MGRAFRVKELACAMEAILVLLCLLPVTACMTSHVDLTASTLPENAEQKLVMIPRVEYDVKGRPFFGERLKQRPKEAGAQFTVVRLAGSRAVESHDILVHSEEGLDMMRPLEVIYHWTGEGFQGGMALTPGMEGFSGSARELAAYMVVRLVPVAVGGAIGFAVGVAASIPEAAAELKKVIVNARENVVSYTRYEYDEQGRIASMRMYAPGDRPVELVRTDYSYSGTEALPLKTVVTSYPENKVRTLP
jgi:hypothetical protein